MRSLFFSALAMFAQISFAHADDLKISFTPANGVLIAPGPDSSCVDLQLYAKHGGQLATSLSGPVILFNDFSIQLTAHEIFYVQGVQVTIKGKGIVGGVYSESLLQDETTALIGANDLTLVGPIRMHSADVSRKLPYASCGLAIGNIPLVSGPRTARFKADITVSVFGTLKQENGRANYIVRDLKTKGEYFGQ